MIAYLNRITDHGGLTGLSDDDHTLYFKADGSRNLTGNLITSGQGIRPAANSTTAIQVQQADGTSFVNFDSTNKRVGIGTTSPSVMAHIYGVSNTLRIGYNDEKYSDILTTSDGYITFQPSGARTYFNKSGANNAFYVYDYRDDANTFMVFSALNFTMVDSSVNTVVLSCTSPSYLPQKLGLYTKSPTNALSFGGNAARTIWLERHTTAATTGNNLTVQAGGCKASETNIGGGALNLDDGLGTGSGYGGGVFIRNYYAGGSGTADNSQINVIQARNNQIGFWNSTPASKQTLAAYTTDTESDAYTAQSTEDIAKLADLNALRVAYENLRASFDDLRTKIVTSTFMATA